MTVPQLMPWIGGATKFEADFSDLICPINPPPYPPPLAGEGRAGVCS